MKGKYKEYIVILLFGLLSIFVFRDYFFKHTVPFPGNLLVSFYNPWIPYKWEGYTDIPNKPIGFDNLRIFYPLRKLTIEQLLRGQWPLWNPYNFSGTIHLATYQSAVFHPLSFLFLIFPQIDAWSAIIIFQPFLSCVFMYLFLREINFSKKASIFGAITFSFSGYLIVWWQESFMSVYSGIFLPLILFSIEKIYKKLSAWYFYLLTLSLAFSILSGWFQMTFYVWFFSVAWVIFRYVTGSKKQSRLLLWIAAAYMLAIFISAIHLFPSIEGYIFSARGNTDAKFIFDSYLLPFRQLIVFLAPDFFGNPAAYNYFGGGFYYEKVLYIGILPLFFVLYELITKKVTKEEKFFKLTWLVTLSLAFSLPTSWLILYHAKLPFLSVMLPTRIIFLFIFASSVLTCFGIEKYFSRPLRKKVFFFIYGVFIVGLISAGLYAYFFFETSPINHRAITLRNLILPTIILCISGLCVYIGSLSKLKGNIYYIFLILTFLPVAYFANKYLYFSNRSFIYPQTPLFDELKKISKNDRFWATGEAYIEKNFATYFHLFSPEGYDSLYIKRYGELLFAALNKGKFSQQIPRTDAIISNVSPSEVLNDHYRKRLLSLLGVRYIVTKNYSESEKEKVIPSFENFRLVWKDNAFVIYEYKGALPRVFLASNYLVEKDEQKILDAIFSEDINLLNTVILEESPNVILKNNNTGKADIIAYEPNRVVLETVSDENAMLFISDNFYPGWKAFVDNNETKIYRANYSFRGIVVPEGKHTVLFIYKPLLFSIGLYTTFFSLVVVFFLGVYIYRRQ